MKSSNFEIFLVVFIAATIFVSVCLASVDLNDGIETPKSEVGMPKLFDFGRFKEMFNKKYDSFIEMVVRQKLFLARASRAFVSTIKYLYRKSSYYLKINIMSDWTPKEIKSTLNRPDEIAKDIEPEPEQMPLANLKDIESEIEEIKRHAHEPGYKELANELSASQTMGVRRRRSATEGSLPTIDDIMGSPESSEESPEIQSKIRTRIASNNEEYVEPELFSYGTDDKSEAKTPVESLVKDFSLASSAGILKTSIVSTASDVSAFKRGRRRGAPEITYEVNHVDSGCFLKPKHQGKCGSCYSFAWTGLMEYMHCKETGQLVPFSEQYMVDCGNRMSKLYACGGGFLPASGEFILKYGLELRSNYPYRGKEDTCPYDRSISDSKMGYLKASPDSKLIFVNRQNFESQLKITPLVIAVQTHMTDFYEYGGGVHEPKCNGEADHAVLLVGLGVQDGKRFWLIRNSYGTTFGPSGYYKLAIKSECIKGSAYYLGKNSFSDGYVIYQPLVEPKANADNDESHLKKRKEEYDNMGFFGKTKIKLLYGTFD